MLALRTWLWVVAGGLGLSACQTPPVSEQPAEPVADSGFSSRPLKHWDTLKNLKPMPEKPLTVSSQCVRKDELGTLTRLKLKVKDSTVSTFSANIEMPQKGRCQFDLKDFRQTAKLPQVILTHREHQDCTVRMWSQERQVTITYNACAQACSGSGFDYLWPTLVDSRSGRCD